MAFKKVSLIFLFILLFSCCVSAETKRYVIKLKAVPPPQVSATFLPFTVKGIDLFEVSALLKKGRRLLDGKSVVVNLDARELKRVKGTGYIRMIEEDKRVRIRGVPSDPAFSEGKQWGLTGEYGIQATQAWGYTAGSGAIVAIIDTGIDYAHPDLSANNLIEYNYNFVDETNDAYDDNGHGSHVAGIVAGVGNNGIGITGTAWQAKTIALKALDAQGSGYISDVADAVLRAVLLKDQGVPIAAINLSLGGSYSKVLAQALEEASARGIPAAIAAGNESGDNDDKNTASYPAANPYPNIIAVAATDSTGRMAYFSNYGRKTVDIAAPGVGIYSTVPVSQGEYDYLSGTSMASPFVAGVIALMKSSNTNIAMSQITSGLFSSATPLQGLRDYTISGALLNAEAAVITALGAPDKAEIFGRVYSKKGKGVSGVTVTLKFSSGVSMKSKTAVDGSFLFDALDSGNYTLVVSKKGYRFSERSKSVSIDSSASNQIEFLGKGISASKR